MNGTDFDFGKRLSDLTTGFLGRGWLIETIDAFIAGDADRCLVIVGEAGIGKSALSARLIQLGKIQAYHFCVTREGGTLDPIAFSRSLSGQLTRSLDGFGEQLVNQAPMKKIDVTQEIKNLEGGTVYGVYIDKFIVQARSADEAFQTLVREPLRSWASSQPATARVVLLTDALDEAARLDRHPNIADLIDAARDLPPQVRWVLTSRPDGPLTMLPGRHEMILDRSEGNLKDAGEFVDTTLAEPPIAAALQGAATDVTALRRELLARSSGNFLYLKYVLQALRDDVAAGRPPAPPERLPQGLDAVYNEFLARVLAPKAQDDWRRIYRPVLGVLAVAQEALTFEALALLSGVDEQSVSDVVEDLRQFLDVPLAGEAGSYRIYHTSFADFLTDRARNPTHWADPVLYHDQVANRLLKRFGPVLAKCQVEKPLDRYALRHTAIHLARAASLCRDAGQGEKQHDFTQRLVRLALASGFQDDFEGKLGDLPAIHRIVEEATRRAAEDDDPEGLPLAVETALGLVSFRRRRLTPDKIFTHAAEGDVEGAEIKLGLFAAEQDWRQAARLQIAWLAARKAGDTARNLHAQVTASPNPVPPVAILGQRIGAVLAGQGWPKTNLPDVSEEKAQALLARLGSLKSKIGLPDEGAWEAMHMGPEENSYSASIRLSDADSLDLVAYAARHPEAKHDYVRDQLRILASNSYAQYRNRFLWPLLYAVLQHPDPDWAQDMVTAILTAALSASPLEFDESLPLAILACRAATDPTAQSILAARREQAMAEALPLRADESAGDSWGSHTRRLAGLAQGYALLQRHGIAGAGQTAQELLALAGELHFGFAGFQAPAWLTLAEAIRVCSGDAGSAAVRKVLDSAANSAHNVQDPTFCARTTARFNALRELWWSTPPGGFDAPSLHVALHPDEAVLRHEVEPRGFPAAPLIEAFCHTPDAVPCTALHRMNERYEGRGGRGNFAPTPDWALNATTLSALARLYGFPEADFRRLNPGLDAETPLKPELTPLICVPDPEFPPLLAARMAAEVLADPLVAGREERIRLIQRLVPIAAANPTALDSVLARLVLAAHPAPVSTLDRMDEAAQAAHPKPGAAVQGGTGTVSGLKADQL